LPEVHGHMNKKITFCGKSPFTSSKSLLSRPTNRVFLLSPANLSGSRGQVLLNTDSDFELARRLRSGEATLGESFSFISSLYFRGKLAYAARFASPVEHLPKSYVITASRGLLQPETTVDTVALRNLAESKIDLEDSVYRAPLEHDALILNKALGEVGEVILLGSIATDKYVKPLLEVFGRRLLFPPSFVGRGDMSRGGLLLRCVRENTELTYVPVAGSLRTNKRPSKSAVPRPG
jgi:hypothetical protein